MNLKRALACVYAGVILGVVLGIVILNLGWGVIFVGVFSIAFIVAVYAAIWGILGD